MDNDELGNLVVATTAKVEMLEKGVIQLRDRFDNHITEIVGRLDELKEDLHGRPSWVVSIVITLLVGACVMLFSLVLQK